jgi:hypothetical protein
MSTDNTLVFDPSLAPLLTGAEVKKLISGSAIEQNDLLEQLDRYLHRSQFVPGEGKHTTFVSRRVYLFLKRPANHRRGRRFCRGKGNQHTPKGRRRKR